MMVSQEREEKEKSSLGEDEKGGELSLIMLLTRYKVIISFFLTRS